MSTTCLEAPVALAPAVEAAPTPLPAFSAPVVAEAALTPPAPSTTPILTTSDIFTATALSVQYGEDATVSISDDVIFPTECMVEMDVDTSSAGGSTISHYEFQGAGLPWRSMPMYTAIGSTMSIKKLWLKGYATNKLAWGYNYKTCSATADTTWSNYVVGGTHAWSNYLWYGHKPPEKTKEEIFREKLQANLRPEIVTKNQQLWGLELTEEELRARTLLYELIGNLDFRRYLRRGFIMVTGKSGTMYKISGGHNRIVSYKKSNTGRFMPFEEFCVVFSQYNLPFTDGVIMRKLLVEHDEFSLRKKSNVFQVGEPGKFTATPAPILRAG